jgi:hypothetical protein
VRNRVPYELVRWFKVALRLCTDVIVLHTHSLSAFKVLRILNAYFVRIITFENTLRHYKIFLMTT